MASTDAAPTPSALGEALHQTLWAMRTHTERALEDSGISFAQSRVLWLLHEYETLSLGKLAKLQGMTPANFTGIIDRLERDGLVKRTRDAKDKRVVVVSLTPAGTARTRRGRKAIEQAMGELFADADPAELTVVLKVLAHVRQKAETANQAAP